MKVVIFALGFLFLLSGCAPVYVVKNQYTPPADKNSQVCLQQCVQQKQTCKQRCAEDYSDCLSYAYDSAKKIQAKSDITYKKRYDRYLEKLNEYNLNIFDWQNRYDQRYSDWKYFSDKCTSNADRYACDREDELRHAIKKLRRTRPREPREPKYITFDEIVKTQQQKCSKKCACDDLFDSCFVSCGGAITPQRICVENCD